MDKKKNENIIKGISATKTFLEGLWIFLKIVAVVVFVLFLIYILKLIPDIVSNFEEVILYAG